MRPTRQNRGWGGLISAIGLVVSVSIRGAEVEATDFPPSSEEVRAEISGVVHAQLDAIKTADWPRAYALAAAGIREKFDLAAFAGMIRTSYPSLIEPRTATTLRVNDNGVQAVLELRLVVEPGILVHFRYFLQIEHDAWRIVGVVPYEPPAVRS